MLAKVFRLRHKTTRPWGLSPAVYECPRQDVELRVEWMGAVHRLHEQVGCSGALINGGVHNTLFTFPFNHALST